MEYNHREIEKKWQQFWAENQTYKVEIDGHTDNVGSEDDNLKLSKDRALSVMQYIIEHSADKNRISSNGFGEAKPVADNSTDEGRALNRRVEFKILTNDLKDGK